MDSRPSSLKVKESKDSSEVNKRLQDSDKISYTGKQFIESKYEKLNAKPDSLVPRLWKIHHMPYQRYP